jgi:predicted nuclease with TOPRIM domain
MASGPRLRKRAREIAEHQSEVDQLKGRIRELEGTNSALGISYRALARVERARARYGADERSERFIAAEKVLVRSLTKLTGSQRRPSNRLALALDVALPAEPPRACTGPDRPV